MRCFSTNMFSIFIRRNSGRVKNDFRGFSHALAKEKPSESFKMQAWQVHSYGEEMVLSSLRTPIVHNVSDLLVKVESASVNPIDSLMKDGYARTILNVLRRCEMELPLTLGRDFSGVIVGKGLEASDKYKIGDRVYGFIPLHKQGSFAEYVLAEDKHIQHHPEHLRPGESSSIIYAAMTAYGALFITGGLQFETPKNKRVLILGASGGVGTVAVQLLKSQGVHVSGTCSTDAVSLVQTLGADVVFDYKQKGYLKEIGESKFDIILDCAKFGVKNVPNNWKFKQFISLNSPLMFNTDKHGLLGGLVRSGSSLLCDNVTNLKDGKVVKWGFFVPSQKGLKLIDELVKAKEIKPILHKEFDFAQLPEALNEVNKGHLRGKVVINMTS